MFSAAWLVVKGNGKNLYSVRENCLCYHLLARKKLMRETVFLLTGQSRSALCMLHMELKLPGAHSASSFCNNFNFQLPVQRKVHCISVWGEFLLQCVPSNWRQRMCIQKELRLFLFCVLPGTISQDVILEHFKCLKLRLVIFNISFFRNLNVKVLISVLVCWSINNIQILDLTVNHWN